MKNNFFIADETLAGRVYLNTVSFIKHAINPWVPIGACSTEQPDNLKIFFVKGTKNSIAVSFCENQSLFFRPTSDEAWYWFFINYLKVDKIYSCSYENVFNNELILLTHDNKPEFNLRWFVTLFHDLRNCFNNSENRACFLAIKWLSSINSPVQPFFKNFEKHSFRHKWDNWYKNGIDDRNSYYFCVFDNNLEVSEIRNYSSTRYLARLCDYLFNELQDQQSATALLGRLQEINFNE